MLVTAYGLNVVLQITRHKCLLRKYSNKNGKLLRRMVKLTIKKNNFKIVKRSSHHVLKLFGYN